MFTLKRLDYTQYMEHFFAVLINAPVLMLSHLRMEYQYELRVAYMIDCFVYMTQLLNFDIKEVITFFRKIGKILKKKNFDTLLSIVWTAAEPFSGTSHRNWQ